MSDDDKVTDTLTGQLLVAMPTMEDPRFAKSVIYVCAHGEDGAMGIIVNSLFDSITFQELMDQLEIETDGMVSRPPVHYGGPVDSARGFVLHSPDVRHDSTMPISDEVVLTATLDILRDIASGSGPERFLFALGYAGWGAGQLDGEIQANGWLTVPADNDIVFDRWTETKWNRAIAKLGIDASMLSGSAGHA